MIKIHDAILKKTTVTPEKVDSKGKVTTPTLIEVTMVVPFETLSKADFANIARAQAFQDEVLVSLDVKQQLIEFHEST